MKKQTMIIIGVAVVVVIVVLFVIFSSGSGVKTNKTEPSSSSETSPNSETSSSSEKQKYAKFEAELACELFDVTMSGDLDKIMQETETIMTKHGYTSEEVTQNKEKYKNDDSYKELTLSEMEKICPETAELASP